MKQFGQIFHIHAAGNSWRTFFKTYFIDAVWGISDIQIFFGFEMYHFELNANKLMFIVIYNLKMSKSEK